MMVSKVTTKFIQWATAFNETVTKSIDRINSMEFLALARKSKRNFTRERKMGFVKLIKCLLNFPRQPLPLEIDRFGELVGDKNFSMTKQAFSKARQNIKPEAFLDLLHLSVDTVMCSEAEFDRTQGYRIFAVDGTELEIEPNPATLEAFGTREQRDKRITRARASMLCEVSKGIVIDAVISHITDHERAMAKGHIDFFAQYGNENDLLIFDRGYPSSELFSILSCHKFKYICRIQRNYFRDLPEETEFDITRNLSYKGISFSVRIIKFLLDSGESEILVTNLPSERVKSSDFLSLYFLRWGIESKYNTLKSKLLIEHFSGKTPIAIQQDFYATLYLSNIVALAKAASDEIVNENDVCKNLKNQRQTNEKLLIGRLKDNLVLMMLCSNRKKREKMFMNIITAASKITSEIRPGRSFQRPKDANNRRRHRLKTVL